MALGETADLAVRLSLDDRFSRGIRGAQRSLSGLEGSIRRVGRGTGQLATGLARIGTIGAVAVAGGLAYAARQAVAFEDAFAGIEKTLDATPEQFAAIERSIRDMATTIPVAATELAAIGETAGALGIAVADVDDFIEVVAKLGVTTDLTSEAAASALGKVGTILHLTGQDFEDFADSLVHLGNIGASTESEIIEITKRFAAAGRQAGLTKEDILALSSAAASFGIEPEAAGGALSRLFFNMSAEIALATDKGKAFATITGRSLKSLTESIRRGEGLDIFRETLAGIAKLDPVEQAKALRALGITATRDRDAFVKMASGLEQVDYWLREAHDSAGALDREASKRFDTVASKIKLLQNNIAEAAITIGEGFAPAIGRAATKLSDFLKQDANRAQLKALGEDIGRFIDQIDWQEVIAGGRTLVSVLKSAADAGLTLLGIIGKLPKELLAAGAAAITLNKLSGGLLGAGAGNIIGGIVGPVARNVGAAIPGIGRAFIQPVFVTNFPPGLKGGIGGATAGFPFGAVAAGGATIVAIQEVSKGAARSLAEGQGAGPAQAELLSRIAAMGVPGMPDLLGTVEDIERFLTGQPPRPTVAELIRAVQRVPLPRTRATGGGGLGEDRQGLIAAIGGAIRGGIGVLSKALREEGRTRLRLEEHERAGARSNLTALFHGPLADALKASSERTSYLLSANVSKALPKTLASDIRGMTTLQARLLATGDIKGAERVGSYIVALQRRLDELTAAQTERLDKLNATSARLKDDLIESTRITRQSGQEIAAAIRDKEWSPTVNVKVPVSLSITARTVTSAVRTWYAYGNGSQVGVGRPPGTGPLV